MSEFHIAAWLLLGGFILFSYTAEAMTGFGSIVIAISLGALLFPIEYLQAIMVPLNICMTSFLSWKHRAHIDWGLLGRLIMPFMIGGTLAGFVFQPFLGGAVMKAGFALLILWFAVRELLRMRGEVEVHAKSAGWARGIIGAAGVTHGLYASGGPLLVYGLAGMKIDKARFRATLIFVWFALNAMLTALYVWDGRIQQVWLPLLCFLPLLPLGIWIGEHLHHKVDENEFRRWIYRVLVLAGLALLLASSLSLFRAV